MATHPSSMFTRSLDIGTAGDRQRPVDSLGHCRMFATVQNRSVNRAGSAGIGFRGHAALFNSRALIGGKRSGFWEELAPGAFNKTLREADVRFLLNHDPSLVLARNKAGTLRLSEDGSGLLVDADMGPYTYTTNVAVGLERGDLSQMSFAFDPISYDTLDGADGLPLIRHTEVRLYDVSIVTFPAYSDTDASLRSRIDMLPAPKRERILVQIDEELHSTRSSVAGPEQDDHTDMTTCPVCNAPIAEGQKFCGDCGSAVTGRAGHEGEQKRVVLSGADCAACGASLIVGGLHCPNCGVGINEATCAACGTVVPGGASYCPHCGDPVSLNGPFKNSAGPAEATRNSEPDDSTRSTSNTSSEAPPAETTGSITPFRRLAELRARELASLFE